VVALLRERPQLAALEIIATGGADYNKRIEGALRETGVAIVVVQATGRPAGAGKSPQLYLENTVMVSVLENPATNLTGRSCLEYVEEVLLAVHQADWPAQRGLQNVLTVDTPAYEAGPLDGGLTTYFCNFKVTTIQSAHE
jgi:hypothetical protein